MKQELKTAWLAALRSGDIAQGRNSLGKPDTAMCCLGVLCHVQEKDLTKVQRKPDMNGYGARLELPWAERAYPPTEWAGGLSIAEAGHCAGMNDNGKSFAQIADWIEENVNAE